MNKTVMITGASGGIGSALARKFASEGWNCILLFHRSTGKMTDLKDELITRYGMTPRVESLDVSDGSAVSSFFEKLESEGVTIDLLINNAGISYVGLLQDMSDEDWKKVIDTNLSSAFYLSKGVLPSMIAAKSGAIINISSVWGNTGASMEVAYSASKGGMQAFTKALAKEVAPSGISVNAIACGYIDTEMNSHLSEDEKRDLFEEIPAGRPGTPNEVANVAYLLSQAGSYLTGQIITLDGGWT
jgi:3-oxoacyl-[acyl-carrier protein] reductase